MGFISIKDKKINYSFSLTTRNIKQTNIPPPQEEKTLFDKYVIIIYTTNHYI